MPTRPLSLDVAAVPLQLSAGQEVTLKGSYRDSGDGTVFDAATTTRPADGPGGARIDAVGLVDFEAGGLRVTARDPATHEVTASVEGAAPGCAAAGVSAPCLVLRVGEEARVRLLTKDAWRARLQGGIQFDAPEAAPMVAAPLREAPSSTEFVPTGLAAALVVAAAALGAGAWWRRRRSRPKTPREELLELARRVSRKLREGDPILAAPLAKPVERTLASVEAREFDPAGAAGLRVREALLRVETELDQRTVAAREERDHAAADDLVTGVDAALDAAREVLR